MRHRDFRISPNEADRTGIARSAGAAALCLLLMAVAPARGELPSPVLHHVYPAGGQAGTSVAVTVAGTGLDGLSSLRFADPLISVAKGAGNEFRVTLPADIRPGVYDVRAVGTLGISGPRVFVVGAAEECRDAEPNDTWENLQQVAVGSVVNGRFDKPGDIDCFRWTGRAGQLVVLDLCAERIDSPAHAVLEVYNAAGRRLAVNRGDRGIDPRIDFRVPADGEYRVRLFDQTFAGGADFVYRLEIDTTPRVDLALPMVVPHEALVQRGKPIRVALLGRNLSSRETATGSVASSAQSSAAGSVASSAATSAARLDRLDVDLPAQRGVSLPLLFGSRKSAQESFSHQLDGVPVAVPIGVTDVPVAVEAESHAAPASAQVLAVPSEVCGQLLEGDEKDWFAVDARKGETLWIEAFGERVGSPVDLDLAVLSADQRELLHLTDEVENLGGIRFPTDHSDPAGRFVAPADGRYLLMLRNVTGGLEADPRRVYRLSVRREEPDFRLVLIPRRSDQPTGINVPRGGRERADLLVFRHRGFAGPIRVAAENLPTGIECPDTWIGPEQARASLVLTANREAPAAVGTLTLVGRVDLGGTELVRRVRGGTMVRAGHPTGWGRFTEEIAVAVASEAGVRVTATPQTTTLFQESVLDVMVDVERGAGCVGPIEITSVGLPRGVENAVATIPAGETRGWLSLAIPASLAPGPYTFAVQAEAETVNPAKAKVAVTTVSEPITVRVEPARIRITIDPRTPRKVARGKIIQVKYRAERLHGFIGKIHTELAAPGGVTGIRGRGVTFTSQQETGDIQVIATENAAPGRLVYLRLNAVGTVEDQPVYHAGRFLELEITE